MSFAVFQLVSRIVTSLGLTGNSNMNRTDGFFLKQVLALIICLTATHALALRLDVKEEEVSLKDRKACQAMASAWSKGREFAFGIKPIKPPKTDREVKLRVLDSKSNELIDGLLIGQLAASGGRKLQIIEVQSGGTCGDVATVVAKSIGRSSENTYEAVISSGIEVEKEFENPAKEAYDALRWGSSFGITEKLFRINGELFKATGRFVDLRPTSKFSAGSNKRNLSLLFKHEKNIWTPICSFESTQIKFRTRETGSVCTSLAQGKFSVANLAHKSGLFELSGATSNAPPLKVRLEEYASGAGCGANFGWLYADDEFRGKTREQILNDGTPNSLELNNMPTYGTYARGVQEVLYERYKGAAGAKSIGVENESGRWPDFADSNMQVLEVDGVNVIQRSARIHPANAWNYDIDILQNRKEGVLATCRGQIMQQMRVKFWYQP